MADLGNGAHLMSGVTQLLLAEGAVHYPDLTASAAPSSQTWTGSIGAYSTPGNFTCTAGGGSGNYTYSWDQDSGIIPVNFTAQSSASSGVTSATNDAATVRCLVSDDAGSTPVYSNSVSVNP